MGRGNRAAAKRRAAGWMPRGLLAVALAAALGWSSLSLAASAASGVAGGGFVTLTLQDALQRALEYHPAVVDARESALQAELGLEREEARRRIQASVNADVAGLGRDAKSGGYKFVSSLLDGNPITVSSNWQIAAGTSLSARVSEEPGSGQGASVLSLSLSQQLVPHPRHSEAERSRLSTLESAPEIEMRLERARASALIDVYRRYRNLQVEEARIALQALALELAVERYDETMRRFESGLASETDIESAALERDRSRAALERAQREHALAKAAFARDVGLGGAGELQLEPLPKEFSWSEADLDLEATVSQALAASVDYLAAQRNLRTAERRHEAALANSGLRASFSVSVSMPEWQGATPTFSAMLGATYDLADGGARDLERRDAEIALERAERALVTSEASIRADVVRRLSDLEWLLAQVDFAQRNLELAERTHAVRLEQALRGAVAERTVKESERSAAEARLALVEAIVSYEAARLDLLALTGRPIEIEGVQSAKAQARPKME